MRALPVVPASLFGVVLGLAGLGGAWRAAHRVWGLPAAVGEAVMLLAALVWALVLALFAAKWVWAPGEARREAADPVQCCFLGLAGVATMLVGTGAALPHSRPAAVGLFGAGALFTLAFAVWRAGRLWQGGREPGATTPILYLPAVAGSFVTAAGAALGRPDWGQLAFGAGLFSWLAVESVLLHRLYTADPLPGPLRPTLGLQSAPPAVGAVALVPVTGDTPGLLPWVAGGRPFAASYWSFSFGATALSTALLLLAEREGGGSGGGPASVLAGPVFAAVNALLVALAAGTLRWSPSRSLSGSRGQ